MARSTFNLTAVLAALAIWSGPAASTAWCTNEGLVPFHDLRSAADKSADPSDDTSGAAIIDLYRQHYGKPNAVRQDIDVDSFLTYQATVSEFLMKPELHKEAELNFDKLIRDGTKKPDLYYVSTWAASKTTAYDNSGDIHACSKDMTGPDMQMDGKLLYFPSEECLQKIVDIEKETETAAAQMSSTTESMNEFFTKKEELEKKLLQVIADELVKMRDMANASGADVYGMGFIQAPDGTLLPLKLNMDVLKNFMSDHGVDMPAPGNRPPAVRAAAAPDVSAPLITVRQSATAQQDINSAYDTLMKPLSESKRTEMELRYDPFRLRGLPANTGSDNPVKTYDPLSTFEYQSGGLNLPSAKQEE